MAVSERSRRFIAAHFPYGEDIAYAVQHTDGLNLSELLAILTLETGGRNVFGHDPVRRGQVVGGKVTRARYAFYRARRRLGLGNQGVGPMQLTSPGLQDQADRLGGCWKPKYNILVGARFIADLKRQHGGSFPLAAQHYNGSGPAAELYGRNAAALARRYHVELTG